VKKDHCSEVIGIEAFLEQGFQLYERDYRKAWLPYPRLLRATRTQLAKAIHRLSHAIADRDAARTRAEQYTEFLRVVGQPQHLQAFLQARFPNTWAGLADGRPLVLIVQEIITALADGRTLS